MKTLNLAAIDVGSNGARLLIKSFDESMPANSRIKKLMFVRIPLRLGRDVFSLGKISKERERMMLHMMIGFKHFMEMNKVDAYRACATAAMREAENGGKIIKRIEKATGIRLEIIRGDEEAQLLCNNLVEYTDSSHGNFAYVDVGGGSTEISIVHNDMLVASCSYNIGTLRLLNGQVALETRQKLEADLTCYASKLDNIQIVGSGGNINKLYKLSNVKDSIQNISVEELRRLYKILQPLSIQERINRFNLKDDRADVIVPACEIFLDVAQYLKTDKIIVPTISLADSIVDGLYKNIKANKISICAERDK